MGERSGVTNKMAMEHRRGSKCEKTKTLDQLCELTVCHRDRLGLLLEIPTRRRQG